ncbi:MAG: Acetyltransferase [Noviherbaspirillum sp.]|nr:Acetyltransferase [Noviherbaspirillum sp.]
MIGHFTHGARSLRQPYFPHRSTGLPFRRVGGQGHLLVAPWMGKANFVPRTGELRRVPYKIAILADGTPATIRELRPGDRSALIEFLQGLSRLTSLSRGWRVLTPEASHLRANAHIGALPSATDGLLVMTAKNRLIGLASFHQMKDEDSTTGDCEICLVIADHWQEKKAGKQLLGSTIGAARNFGFNKAVALIAKDNGRSLKLVKHFDFVHVSTSFLYNYQRMERSFGPLAPEANP